MSAEAYSNQNLGNSSLLDSFREIVASGKDVLHNEVNLVKEELKSSVESTAKHSLQMLIFSLMVALSTIPFIAFLVLGLGELLNGRYWLSSLIVSVFFAVVGGTLARSKMKEIKEQDLHLAKHSH